MGEGKRGSTLPWMIGSVAVIAVGAAGATLVGTTEQRTRLPGKTELDNQPLVLNDQVLGRIDTAPRDQLAAMRQRPPLELGLKWSPTGLMGDGKAAGFVRMDAHFSGEAYSGNECIRLVVEPGPTRWAGLYWLNQSTNWGQHPGVDLSGYQRVSFYAKGTTGKERVEFMAGGVDATNDPEYIHKDSFKVSLGKVELSKQWKAYRIFLRDMDLSNVIGGFGWIATTEDNPNGLTFYLDDIRYE